MEWTALVPLSPELCRVNAPFAGTGFSVRVGNARGAAVETSGGRRVVAPRDATCSLRAAIKTSDRHDYRLFVALPDDECAPTSDEIRSGDEHYVAADGNVYAVRVAKPERLGAGIRVARIVEAPCWALRGAPVCDSSGAVVGIYSLTPEFAFVVPTRVVCENAPSGRAWAEIETRIARDGRRVVFRSDDPALVKGTVVDDDFEALVDVAAERGSELRAGAVVLSGRFGPPPAPWFKRAEFFGVARGGTSLRVDAGGAIVLASRDRPDAIGRRCVAPGYALAAVDARFLVLEDDYELPLEGAAAMWGHDAARVAGGGPRPASPPRRRGDSASTDCDDDWDEESSASAR